MSFIVIADRDPLASCRLPSVLELGIKAAQCGPTIPREILATFKPIRLPFSGAAGLERHHV
jgi:hypothetical protein